MTFVIVALAACLTVIPAGIGLLASVIGWMFAHLGPFAVVPLIAVAVILSRGLH